LNGSRKRNPRASRKLGAIQSAVAAVLQKEVSAEVPVWLVTHGELKTNARIRAIFDILSEELTAGASNR
jgi:hypothetical protein